MPSKKVTLGFIGAGRAGTGLASGFARAGVNVVAIASRTSASAQKLAKRVRGARACAPQEVADRADIAFLTVPDDAIEGLASSLRWRKGAACVHCSGAADNVEKLGAAGGLGSAIARGDAGTIRRHLDVLAREAPDSLELYRILSLRTIPLALAKGTLEPAAAREITALLEKSILKSVD